MLKYIVTQKGGMIKAMKVVGIIAEYNPFHTGHQFHIEEARRLSGADAVIVVLSGNFTQRGEPALLEKHVRARMAVEGDSVTGADLVLELPSLYAAASAEYFAWGGVSALHATGVVDTISFGTEADSITPMQEVAQLLLSEPPALQESIKRGLAEGLSYPKSRELALEAVTGQSMTWLQAPNNILAVEYLKANTRLGNPLHVLPIQRKGAGYHETSLSKSAHPSATALRQALVASDGSDGISTLRPHMPSAAFSLLQNAYDNGQIANSNALFLPIVTLLRTKSIAELQQLPYIAEGLEYRCKQAAQSASSLEELVDACSSARYPRSRIRRIFTALLTGITAENLTMAKQNPVPYLRVLAFNQTGRQLLKEMKQAATLPIITKPAALHNFTDFAGRVAQIEANATDTWYLTCTPPQPAGQDYQITPLFLPDSDSHS